MLRLGMTIKKLRIEQGISQKALAAKAGLTGSFVSLIENDRRVPSMTVITRLASALGVPVEVLIWDAINLPPNLSERDRRLCEMARLIVRRFYESRDDDPTDQETEDSEPHRHAM